jgi:hypothetical protein
MAEWFKAAVLKTVSPERRRGFESLSLRHVFLPCKKHGVISRSAFGGEAEPPENLQGRF